MKYFDLHCDTPYRMYEENLDFDSEKLSVNSREDIFEEYYQCFAVWLNDNLENPFQKYKQTLKNFKEKFQISGSKIKHIFTVEGGAVLEGNIENLYLLKDDGIRALTLTWNGKNGLASGVDFEGGLTDFGREAVRVMNSLKIACDLSHLNRESFYGALEETEYPIATHSCSYEVYPHKRNLTDDQIKELFLKGGIIGLCFYPKFLGEGDVFENLYRHLFYLLDKGYENHIALGSDFDGADMDKKLWKVSNVASLYDFLKKKSVNDEILYKIFFKNAKKFFKRV